MKIIHVCLNGPFTEGWGYQENTIAKFHVKKGHDVTIITTNTIHGVSGEVVEIECDEYVNNDNVRVIRVKRKKCVVPIIERFFRPYDISNLLALIKPDIIMVHGFIGSISAFQVFRYIKENPRCKAVVDIHQDSYNSYKQKNIFTFLVMLLRRLLNKRMYTVYEKIFYVAPSSKEFALNYYRAPLHKMELLPLGADPDYIKISNIDDVRFSIIKYFKLPQNSIIFCHGGKLDRNKKTAELVGAFQKLVLDFPNVRLIIFGLFSGNYLTEVFPNGIPVNIIVTGMLSVKEYYEIFSASDLAIFPGSQSVLWQQAIACGSGLLIEYSSQRRYLDLGGNIAYISCSDLETIYQKLKEIIIKKEYCKMKKVSIDRGLETFSYDCIAQKVIDSVLGKKDRNCI